MDGIYPDQVTGSDLRRFLDQVASDVLVVGHTHVPFARPAPGGGLVVNPGALLRGEADDGESAAGSRRLAGGTFAVVELPTMGVWIYRIRGPREVAVVWRR